MTDQLKQLGFKVSEMNEYIWYHETLLGGMSVELIPKEWTWHPQYRSNNKTEKSDYPILWVFVENYFGKSMKGFKFVDKPIKEIIKELENQLQEAINERRN